MNRVKLKSPKPKSESSVVSSWFLCRKAARTRCLQIKQLKSLKVNRIETYSIKVALVTDVFASSCEMYCKSGKYDRIRRHKKWPNLLWSWPFTDTMDKSSKGVVCLFLCWFRNITLGCICCFNDFSTALRGGLISNFRVLENLVKKFFWFLSISK